MYRALYRKWRPRRFEDVVGQSAIVTALQNQIRTGHVGHAYLFTGTRGTGKTTCAKIFAKAINCPHNNQTGDPCGECSICLGIDNGSILDVVEMDAASNNGVDNIRDLRDESVYTPSLCRYKVYIIDEVHMLSQGAFNALLKIMEEPPAHVVFILATTEIHKVPATILSRCQRYDFRRITPEDIAGRVAYVAKEEGLDLTPGACGLISRLADGALRDALSILDTCAGADSHIDEETVQRMAGVTDKSYLFSISGAAADADPSAVLTEVARLRQESVDMKRLCEELIAHYRNLMLTRLPNGEKLLSGVSPQEEALYKNQDAISQPQAIRAIRVLGDALEKMGRGTDPRIELELALFALCQPETAAPAPQQEAPAQPASFKRNPGSSGSWVPSAAPQPEPVPQPEPEPAPAPLPWEDPSAPAIPTPPPPPAPKQPAPAAPAASAPGKIVLFAQWDEVLETLTGRNKMLCAYLKGSKAYFDGKRVLIDGGNTFRDYIRADKDAQTLIKTIIYEKTGVRCPIGPYTTETESASAPQKDLDETLKMLQSQGVEVVVEDK